MAAPGERFALSFDVAVVEFTPEPEEDAKGAVEVDAGSPRAERDPSLARRKKGGRRMSTTASLMRGLRPLGLGHD